VNSPSLPDGEEGASWFMLSVEEMENEIRKLEFYDVG